MSLLLLRDGVHMTIFHNGALTGVLILFTCAATFHSNSNATITGATAAAFVSGTTVRQSFTVGPEGTQATASQTIPSPIGDVFVSAQSSSIPGAVRAASVARTDGSTGGFQGQASSWWSDRFIISAPGYDSSSTGSFSGAVQVTGGLTVEYSGRTYSDTQAYATVDIFPGTGYNGGRTVVSGSARNLVGYQIPGINTGNTSFTLLFLNVPFTYNQPIDISFSLAVSADVNGSKGRADVDYSHTMTWSGLSRVLDSQGTQVINYSAVSAGSGFNFATATPVPEPSSAILIALGVLCIVWRILFKPACQFNIHRITPLKNNLVSS